MHGGVLSVLPHGDIGDPVSGGEWQETHARGLVDGDAERYELKREEDGLGIEGVNRKGGICSR